MGVTRFGLQIPNFTYPGVDDRDLFERIARIAVTAEESGFDSVWVMDHFYQIATVGPRSDPMLEAYTLLGGLAARTTRASLGTHGDRRDLPKPGPLGQDRHHPRRDLGRVGPSSGIGAAWNDDEHAGYGFEFPPVAERMDRLEEALQICRAMLSEAAPTVTGRHYSVAGALNFPRPIRPTGIPILVGGSGERRTLRLVARYADACNVMGDPATVRRKLEILARHCEAEGRDPAEITTTKLGALVIAGNQAEAQRKAREMIQARGMDDERAAAYVVAGDPDSVCEQVAAYLDTGLDGLVLNMHDAQELEPVRLAGEALTRAFG